MAVAYMPELLGRVETWLSHSDSKRRTRENLAELHALYAAITGQPVSSCTHCNFSGYVDILRAYVIQSNRLYHPELMADSQYTLAPGFENETFVHESYNSVLSGDTITDEGAEFFIKHGFAHAFLKGGKPVAETPEPEAPKPTRKADFQARYKELLGQDADDKLTIAQLTEAIEAKEAELAKQD